MNYSQSYQEVTIKNEPEWIHCVNNFIKGELTWKIYLYILLPICSYNAQKTCFLIIELLCIS